jgi:hypothetical protein
VRAYLSAAVVCIASTVLAADDKSQPLVPIDTKTKGITVAVPKDGTALKLIEIGTADALAKSPLFPADSAEKLKKELDFEKDKLIVFAWNGSGRDRLTGALTPGPVPLAAFQYTPGLTFEWRQHARLFVVPRGADIRLSAEPAVIDEDSAVKEIPTKDLKIAFPENPGGVMKPDVITSAEQLTKAPALRGAAEAIGKRVNFDKEKLVFVAWRGASDDKFALGVKFIDAKPALAFQAVPGTRTDLFKHTRLFVVPKEVGVETAGGK